MAVEGGRVPGGNQVLLSNQVKFYSVLLSLNQIKLPRYLLKLPMYQLKLLSITQFKPNEITQVPNKVIQ